MAEREGNLAFPYNRPRPGQLEAANHIREAIEKGSVLALRAPTGFGKTATILKGLLDAGPERVLYVVRTRNEIQPVIRELRRFGATDYTFLYSARRMCPLLEEERLGIDDFWNTCRLLRLRGECAYYASLSDIDEDEIRAVVSSTDSPRQAVKRLVDKGVCPFFALKLLVPSSRIIVATYPYLFRQEIFETVFEPLVISDFVVVVDEAHSLLSLQSLLEARLGIRDLEASIREIEEYGLPSDLAERLRGLEDLVRGVESRGKLTRLDTGALRDLLEEPSIWRDAAEEVRMEKTRERLEEGAPISLSVYLTRVAVFAEALWRDDVGVYLSLDREPVLRVLPLEPCSIVGSVINKAKAAILASGTLPDAEALKTLMCVEKPLVYLDVESRYGPVFPMDTLAVLVTSELTSRYQARDTRIYRLYADYIAKTFNHVRRSLLAVYPSYEFLQRVQEFLRDDIGEMITENRDTAIEEVINTVLTKKHVLVNAVAGGKLTEGIELRDKNGHSLITTVFIAGVPYPQPDDYVKDQVRVLAKKIGERRARSMFFEVNAAIRVLQAVGRARRSPEDAALIILGDYRFTRPSIRRHLGRLMQRYRVVSSLREYEPLVREAAASLDL